MASPNSRVLGDTEAGEGSSDTPESNDDTRDSFVTEGTALEAQKTKSIAESLPLPQEILFVSVVCLAQFTTQAALGQTLAILHVIGDSFGLTNPGDLSWLIAGYSLTVGTFILISGRLGDTFGYKRMLIIGFAWFAVWSMIAGLAVYSNHVLFVFARVLQGIGPAITLTNGVALFGASYAPGPRKDMVFAMFGATAPGGSVVGSVFGSLFALGWWPWAFWSFSITMAIIAVVTVFVVPDPPLKSEVSQKSAREKIRDLDLPGATIGIISLVLINFAWNQAPIVGWDKPFVYVLLLIGILLIPIFFYVEIKVSPNPLIPFDALSTDVGFVLACIACGWGSFGIWVYYAWQFLEEIRDISPLLGSAQIAPVAISGAVASYLTGLLLSRIRPSAVMTIALMCFTTGIIIIMTAPAKQTYWAQFFVSCIVMPWYVS